jgi:hypothetical protein
MLMHIKLARSKRRQWLLCQNVGLGEVGRDSARSAAAAVRILMLADAIFNPPQSFN